MPITFPKRKQLSSILFYGFTHVNEYTYAIQFQIHFWTMDGVKTVHLEQTKSVDNIQMTNWRLTRKNKWRKKNYIKKANRLILVWTKLKMLLTISTWYHQSIDTNNNFCCNLTSRQYQFEYIIDFQSASALHDHIVYIHKHFLYQFFFVLTHYSSSAHMVS